MNKAMSLRFFGLPIALIASNTIAFSISFPAMAVVKEPLPANAYIMHNRLYWAWAAPVSSEQWPLALDFSIQGPLGWRLPTANELLNAPAGIDFLFPGGNVPFKGVDPVSGSEFIYQSNEYFSAKSDGACAAPYFQDSFSHCDFGNAPDQSLGPVPWAGQPGSVGFSEQLVVKEVPAPLAVSGGAVALGFTRKLRRRIQGGG
jgi:hypothetical protein